MDIDENVVEAQPRNFLTHVAVLTFTKTGDGLIDPKLVLSWLLLTPSALHWLVRLPQILTAGPLGALARRNGPEQFTQPCRMRSLALS